MPELTAKQHAILCSYLDDAVEDELDDYDHREIVAADSSPEWRQSVLAERKELVEALHAFNAPSGTINMAEALVQEWEEAFKKLEEEENA